MAEPTERGASKGADARGSLRLLSPTKFHDPELDQAVEEGVALWRTPGPGRKKKKGKKLRAPSGLALVPLSRVRRRLSEAPARPRAADGAEPSDERLAYLEQLEASPLGQAWLTDLLGSDGKPTAKTPAEGVIAPLPRRELLAQRTGAGGSPPRSRRISFEASSPRAMSRLVLWVWAGLRYFAGMVFDALRGKNSMERRAVRLRLILESLGPTFVKLGQQLSIRADVLPYAYCQELSKMLDAVKPFKTELAVQCIERVAGKKLSQIFAVFDPTPIGSASLSCVFQAVRHGGQKVAVKVRRPGIGPLLAADLKALGWILDFAETMSFVRPGLTRNLRAELHSMLMEELNFAREARYTELFRRRAKKKKQNFITAPRIHIDLSGDDVLVTEFVSGVFLWEIIAALDRGDEPAIRAIRARGIDPVQIAKRMVLAFNWETLENLLFHADPHPANIIIRPDNTITFIDFGSCGRFSNKLRRSWMQLHYCLNKEDVNGMVEASISTLEPLPPIDLDRFTKEVENLYWDWLYAMKDKNSEWYEKASGMMWMTFVGLARKYNIPMNLDTLRLFRATFLYDTIMYRLWPEMDMDTEYQHYHKRAAQRAERRVKRSLKRRVKHGLKATDYMELEDFWRMGKQVLSRVQHTLDTPQHNFGNMIGKAAFGISVVLKLAAAGMGIHVFAVVALSLYQTFTGREVSLWATFTSIVSSEWYQLIIVGILLVVVRKALMRVEDIDVERA